MKKKNAKGFERSRFVAFLLLAVMLVSCIALTGCGSEEEELTDSDIDSIMIEGGGEEALPNDPKKAAIAEEKNKDEDSFIGTWVADSPEAYELYGNFKLTINEDGTLDADITDEKFSGTWRKVDKGITFTSEYMKGNIYYIKTGHIVINDIENGDTTVVMHKAN